MTKIRCLDFHRPEWTHRPWNRYYVKFASGAYRLLWAHDACDALDAVDDGTVTSYGSYYEGVVMF